MTTICIFKLLEAKKACRGARSYKDVGRKALGKAGKNIVEILLVTTQVGFVMAYVYFISSQLIGVFSFFGITTYEW